MGKVEYKDKALTLSLADIEAGKDEMAERRMNLMIEDFLNMT